MPRYAAVLIALTILAPLSAEAVPLGLVLPTKNRALFTPHESQYYVHQPHLRGAQ